MKSNPIGVFDSGVGGLTVYKALRGQFPHENFVYLGDTARLPYGTKSADTVEQYAVQAAKFLVNEEIKLLVIACNTASALALPGLQRMLPTLPLVDVILPSARTAALTTQNNRIAVMATESTVRSAAYAKTIKMFNPKASVEMLPCNLLVALAEEGWCEGREAEMVVGRYLNQLEEGFDTLVLGCTHFPLLTPVIRKLVGHKVTIIDSASAVTKSVETFLKSRELFNPQQRPGNAEFHVTDSPERFGKLAKRFLNTDIADNIAFAYLSPNSKDQMQPTKTAKAS
ncbi:MAG TPA: glutamate racemase [Alphaproteobacteria bacterium]|nr:glutamate racemase [Alphaproteobacteria bacterium]